MTRTHAARQLLAHGPLSFGQFAEITGWPAAACRRVLSYLVDDLGEASRFGRVYRMTHGSQLPDVSTLDAQTQGRHGRCESHVAHGAGSVRAGAALGVPATASNMREAKAGRCGKSCAACGVECKGVGE